MRRQQFRLPMVVAALVLAHAGYAAALDFTITRPNYRTTIDLVSACCVLGGLRNCFAGITHACSVRTEMCVGRELVEELLHVCLPVVCFATKDKTKQTRSAASVWWDQSQAASNDSN